MKEGLGRSWKTHPRKLDGEPAVAPQRKACRRKQALNWTSYSYFKLGLQPVNKAPQRALDKHTAASADEAKAATEFPYDLGEANAKGR